MESQLWTALQSKSWKLTDKATLLIQSRPPPKNRADNTNNKEIAIKALKVIQDKKIHLRTKRINTTDQS